MAGGEQVDHLKSIILKYSANVPMPDYYIQKTMAYIPPPPPPKPPSASKIKKEEKEKDPFHKLGIPKHELNYKDSSDEGDLIMS